MAADHPTIAYSPALDGVRAICLTGVLLFHAPFSWMGGGFLGVSTFFTLSGYLITTLLIREATSSGTIGLRAFWDRRMRRLGPALWLGVTGVLLSGPYWLRADVRERLLPDALSTLLYVSNWRFQSPQYAYERLFAAPSPLQHSWSLSIEAQYYLVFPVLLALSFRLGLRALQVGGVLLAALAVSLTAAVVDPTDSATINHVYYGTLPRLAEPLMGGVLALALATPRGAALVDKRAQRGHLLALTGFLVAAAMGALWSQTEVSSAWLYRGGFAFHALLSAIVIGITVGPSTAFTRLLSLPPLPWLGRLSYGAYVYHWPIFVGLSPERTGLDAIPLFGLRVAATVGCAWLSYRFVEQPVRKRRVLANFPRIARASLLLPAWVAATISWQHFAEQRRLEHVRTSVAEIAARVPIDPRLRVGSFGDSTAFLLAQPLEQWLAGVGFQQHKGRCALGCSFVSYGEIFHWNRWTREPRYCGERLSAWQQRLHSVDLDLVIVTVGPWDVLTRRRLPHSTPRAFGDPIFDETFASTLDEAMAMFRDAGTAVIWIAPPPVRFGAEHWPDADRLAEANDPKRMARLRQLVREAAERWPATLRVVDLNAYLEERTGGNVFDPELRPDGVHFTASAMTDIVADWLGPAVLFAADELLLSTGPPSARPE